MSPEISTAVKSSGPLGGIRAIELAGLGGSPFCGMLLADLGAEVIRVGRVDEVGSGGALASLLDISEESRFNVLDRGRRSIAVDLKHPEGIEIVAKLVENADVLIEGFRPGVMERLGLGPEVCLAQNPRLVYGRLTGWGQEGPYAQAPGHDINFIALAGVLDSIGRRDEPPLPPLNLLGDFGGGGMLLAVGVLAALVEAGVSGRGQVVDAAMVDGSSLLMAMMHGIRSAGAWDEARGANFNDTGSHFYNVYETADAKFVAIGAMEPQFHSRLLELLGLDPDDVDQWNRDEWEPMKERLQAIFRTRPLDEWCELLEESEVCFAPVLSMAEAPNHPHNEARRAFVEVDGVTHPTPAPRFSRTMLATPTAPVGAGHDTDEILAELGFSAQDVSRLRRLGVAAGE